MEESHKTIIRKNHSELINRCNFQRLLPKLVEKNVFSWQMINLYEKCDHKSKQMLLFDILGRGPKAFDSLVSSLRETDQYSLANKLLGLDDNTQSRVHSTRFLLPTSNSMFCGDTNTANTLNLCTEPLEIKVIHSTSFKDDFSVHLTPYEMRSKTRGAVLIINNKNFDKPRRGAHIDEENLVALFEQMGGYEITLKVDLDAPSMQKAVQDFARNDTLKFVNVIFVIIMSHGAESDKEKETVVECINGKTVPTSWIENQFYGDKCPSMQNKPKIIIYQICRGVRLDYGVSPIETDGMTTNIPIRTHSDMLVCHSTPQGYKAHRDKEVGSWYIQSICKNFMTYAHSYHVEDLLCMVDENLRELQADTSFRTMQTANFHNTGFRRCYLNPGIYEEDDQLCRYSDRNTQ